MKTAGFLLPASIFGFAALAPLSLRAAVLYEFEGSSEAPRMTGVPWPMPGGNTLAPQQEEPLLADLVRRIALTALPPGDPNLFFVTPAGDPREASEIRLIRDADQRISAINTDGIKALLDLLAIDSDGFAPPAPETGSGAPAAGVADISTTAAQGTVVYSFPSPNAPVDAPGSYWPPLPPIPGGDPGPLSANADLRRQTGMYLLQSLAARDPSAAISQFTAVAPSLASACLKASPDLGELEPLAYLSATGDVLAFARAVADHEPATAIKWYLAHRSLELSDIDTGLADLVGGIDRRDPIVAYALISRLPAKELESAADGIAANAKTSSTRTLLVESLRQPRAAAIQAAVLRSIGHQNATTYVVSAEWNKQPGFTAEEQRLLKEGAETQRLGDPLLRFPAGSTGAVYRTVPR